MSTLGYNLLIAPGEAVALYFLVRTRRSTTALAWLALAGLPAVLIPLLLDASGFYKLRLLSFGIFLHGPLLLGAAALALRPYARPLAALLAVGALALPLIAYDAFWVEPFRLEMSHYRIVSTKLTHPIRILVLADIQTDAVGAYERRALALAMAETPPPDLVLLTGDYVQDADRIRRAHTIEALREVFAKTNLRGSLAAVAVAGNVDEPDWPQIFTGLPVTIVLHTRAFDLGEIRLTALALDDSFRRDLQVPAAPRFHIVFGHGPDFARGDVRADLLIAGHTHGGQVRLPFLGPLLTLSAIPRSWAAGKTDLGDGRTLIVSRGIGMERGPAPRLRFLCRPEIVFLDLVPE